jgi:hypothetical protein
MIFPNETNSIDYLILLTLRMVGNLITPLEFGTLPLNDGGMAQATKKQPAHAGLLFFLFQTSFISRHLK